MVIDFEKLKLILSTVSLALLWVALIGGVILLSNLLVGVGLIVATTGLAYVSDGFIRWSTNANIGSPEEYPDIHDHVFRVSTQANIPKPDIAVIDTEIENAYTTGFGKNSCTITVTEGLLERLDEDELEAVVAHEVSHIKSRELPIVMVLSGLLSASYTVLRFGWDFDDDDKTYYIIGFYITLPVWISTFLLSLAIFRYREYMADRGSVEIIGDPVPLESALQKLDQHTSEKPKQDLRTINSTNSINFVSTRDSSILQLHPSVSDRIEYIRLLK